MSNLTIFEEKGPVISEMSVKLIEEIKTLKIVNEGDEQRATDARERVRVCLKRIEELKDEAVKPLNEQRNKIFAQAKFYTEPLEAAFRAVTGVLKQYMDEQARIAEEHARKLREEQETADRIEAAKIAEALKKQRELEEAAKTANFEEQENLERAAKEEAKKAAEAQAVLDKKEIQLVEAAPKSIRTASGAMTTRKLIWDWELQDIKALYASRPDLFLVDEKKINQLVKKDGVRELPGVRIFQDSTLSGRS